MKKIILFLGLTLSLQSLNAQSFSIYGLWFEQTAQIYIDTIIDPYSGDTIFISGGISGNQHLVSIDPFTGLHSSLGIIDNVEGVAIGSSTFDHNSERYIFWGIDNMSDQRIYNIELANAFITNEAPLNSNTAYELQYDLQQNKLLGLRYELMGEDSLGYIQGTNYLVDIDESTGNVTDIGALPSLQGVVVSTSAYNSNLGHFHFVGIDDNGEHRLYAVNSTDGSIIYNPLIPGDLLLSELHYDVQNNMIYGLQRTQAGGPFSYISLDPITAETTVLNDFPNIEGNFYVFVGASAYEQDVQAYAIETLIDGQRTLLLIDGPSGTVVSSSPLLVNIIEIEVNNKNFSDEFFALDTSVETKNENDIQIYPNPFKNNIAVRGLNSAVPLELYSSDGILIRSFSMADAFSTNLGRLSPGTYFLKNGGAVMKIVKIE